LGTPTPHAVHLQSVAESGWEDLRPGDEIDAVTARYAVAAPRPSSLPHSARIAAGQLAGFARSAGISGSVSV
jgi:hypothetical protein